MFGISVLMGGLLVGLTGASIPIIIHLLHRQRTQPIHWGAMQFLLESPLQQKRRKTVEHWLLMLLRILAIALLALLLARPLWGGKHNPLASNMATDVGLVIDHSLSTGRRSGDRSAYQQGIDALEGLTKQGVLRGADTVSIVLAEHEPKRFTPLPVSPDKLGDELNRLRALKPGLTDASIPEAVGECRELITAKGRNAQKVIIVVSDGQLTGWKIHDVSAWNGALGPRVKGAAPEAKMYELSILPDPQPANVSVAQVKVSPTLVSVGQPAQLDATLVNTGTKEVPATTARLKLDGRQVAQQPVAALPAGQSRTLHFEHAFTDPGSNWAEISVDADDALAADNSAVVPVYAWQNIPVLIIDGKLASSAPVSGSDPASQLAAFNTFRQSRFLQMAMLSDAASPDATSVLRPTIVGALDTRIAAHLDDYECVIVNDVPRLVPEVLTKLADYVRSGHGVWFVLGDRSEPAFITAGLAQAGLYRIDDSAQPRQNPNDKSTPLDVPNPKNPIIAQLVLPEHNALADVKTFKWWSVKPRDPGHTVILRTADTGDPLIVDRVLGSNGGYVELWTTPVDGGAWNDWPSQKMFAPLVNETVYHMLGGSVNTQTRDARLNSGDALQWIGPLTPPVRKVIITRPDGTKAEARPQVRDGRQFLDYTHTDLPGLYTLSFDQSSMPPVYYGVGISQSELDETPLSEADRDWLTSPDHKYLQQRIDAKSLASAIGAPEPATELWPWLAVIVLGTLVFETFMTWRLVRRQTAPASGVVTGGMSGPLPV